MTAAPATVARPKANATPKKTVRVILIPPAYINGPPRLIELIHGTMGNMFLVEGEKASILQRHEAVADGTSANRIL